MFATVDINQQIPPELYQAVAEVIAFVYNQREQRGDNRNNSTDSRFEAVGNIKGDDIVGKAWLRVYPFSDFGLVDNIE